MADEKTDVGFLDGKARQDIRDMIKTTRAKLHRECEILHLQDQPLNVQACGREVVRGREDLQERFVVTEDDAWHACYEISEAMQSAGDG